MIRISDLSLGLEEIGNPEIWKKKAAKKLKIDPKSIRSIKISRKSVDARDKGNVHFSVSVDCELKGDEKGCLKNGPATPVFPDSPLFVPPIQWKNHPRPVVVGLGPGGLFAALYLARAGACPIVLERGEDVDKRRESIRLFQTKRVLNEESNIQFGEGGAGAFSDGKLTTGIKDVRCRTVLYELYAHGAPEEILTLARPHIGTDRLPGVVKAIRQEIIALGGQVHFGARLTDIHTRQGALTGLCFEDAGGNHELDCDSLLLCIGHSAPDTQEMLYRAGISMMQKPFSVGFRIEHRQTDINRAQYGKYYNHPALPAAEYHLSAKLRDGRGVYTFCMCPGGQVVGAASRAGGVCTNGMSPFARNGENANAAVLVDVRTEDFESDHPLAGFAFREKIEQQAFALGGGDYSAPAQLVGDFLQNVPSSGLGNVNPTYRPGVLLCNLGQALPEKFADDLRQGIGVLGRYLKGFDQKDGVLTGVETRSSCPVRILRNEKCQSSIAGLYPVGEGAGYAGGIMSAATDGLRCAEFALERMKEGF